jgi:hypothetical protein
MAPIPVANKQTKVRHNDRANDVISDVIQTTYRARQRTGRASAWMILHARYWKVCVKWRDWYVSRDNSSGRGSGVSHSNRESRGCHYESSSLSDALFHPFSGYTIKFTPPQSFLHALYCELQRQN